MYINGLIALNVNLHFRVKRTTICMAVSAKVNTNDNHNRISEYKCEESGTNYKKGKCTWGDSCKFKHTEQPTAQNSSNNAACKYLSRGSCKFVHKNINAKMSEGSPKRVHFQLNSNSDSIDDSPSGVKMGAEDNKNDPCELRVTVHCAGQGLHATAGR